MMKRASALLVFLVATGTGPDLQHDVLRIVGIAGQQQQLQL